jgi:hypothetical protein
MLLKGKYIFGQISPDRKVVLMKVVCINEVHTSCHIRYLFEVQKVVITMFIKCMPSSLSGPVIALHFSNTELICNTLHLLYSVSTPWGYICPLLVLLKGQETQTINSSASNVSDSHKPKSFLVYFPLEQMLNVNLPLCLNAAS